MALSWVKIAVLLVSAVSADKHGKPLTISKSFMAGSIDPTAGSTGWALTSHGIAEKLFTVDRDGHVVAQVGESVKKLDDGWEVTIKSGYKFSDGTAVTADNVVACMTKLNEVNSGAQASLGTAVFTKTGDLTMKVTSERATPVMAAVLAEWAFTVFLEKDGEYIFTGPYAVNKFVEDSHIDLIPNAHYAQAAGRPDLTIKKMGDGEAAAAALAKGELDMAFHIPVTTLPELRKAEGVTVKSYLAGYQYMMWHNMRKAPLSDKKVRQALDLALDRNELTQATQGGKGTRSFFPENTPYYLKDSELNGQKAKAEALLDEAGWVKNADGKREKDGALLTLKIVAYPQRPSLVIMQPVVKANFEGLGITVNAVVTSADSWDELDALMADKDYDLLMWAQHTMPAGDPQFFINAFFRTDAGSNHAGLASTDVDTLIDALSGADTEDTRVKAAAAAHKKILDEVPVSILMTPSWHVGLGPRMADYEPYGSDYYVVHADLGLTTTVTADSGPVEGSKPDKDDHDDHDGHDHDEKEGDHDGHDHDDEKAPSPTPAPADGGTDAASGATRAMQLGGLSVAAILSLLCSKMW